MNIKFFLEVRRFMVYGKLWVQRTMSWVAIANSGMILFLVLSKLQDYGFQVHITAWFIPIYFGIILIMIFLGYLEDKVGLFREEHRASSARNPYFTDIIERLDRIEKGIKTLKSSKRK